jgi:hypothetical protein
MSHDLTLDQLTKVLPKGFKNNATQKLVDKINLMVKDPIIREAYRDNLLSYTSVLTDGRFQIGHYVDAVKYITHKLMGDSNILAYTKTFPDRYQNFLANGTNDKDIASYVTSYNKNKLVNIIREQTLIPTHILNAGLYQKAINKQASLMFDDRVSYTVQQKAADSLLMHLKAPETAKVELDITVKQDKSIEELQAAMFDYAKQQRKAVVAGVVSVKQVAESKLIESVVED